jgi:hypothetical protein
MGACCSKEEKKSLKPELIKYEQPKSTDENKKPRVKINCFI